MSLASESARLPDESARGRLAATLRDLAEAARSVTTRAEFLRRWLESVTAAAGGTAGLIVELTDGASQIAAACGDFIPGDDTDEAAAAQRRALRCETLERRQLAWLREDSGGDGLREQERLTLVMPLPEARRFAGVAEFQLPGDASVSQQRICVSLVTQACAILEDFFVRDDLRTLTRGENRTAADQEFVRAVHGTLDLQGTAYTIVNEVRRLVPCDRVSLLIRRGGRLRLVAVSGLDAFDLRSPEVKLLTKLAELTVASRQELHSDEPSATRAPAVETVLSAYQDESRVTQVRILPLEPPRPPSTSTSEPTGEPDRPFGALVLERRTVADGVVEEDERLRFLVEHTRSALGNALEHERLFLMPVWRALGRARTALLHRSARRKTLVLGGLVVAILAALVFVRTDLELQASGTFQPTQRRNVFAPLDGTVVRLLVRHGDRVELGTPLLELRNTELEVAATEARGERTAVAEQLASVERALFGEDERLSVGDRVRLSGQRAELMHKLAALREKLQLLEQKLAGLLLRSPIAGTVITWDAERLLRDRPVQRGQSLLTVADTSAAWELEVYLPEHYVGHAARARRDTDGRLPVRFRPTSDPGLESTGMVREIDQAAEVRGELGNTVLLTVEVDSALTPQLKPGVEATALVICGRHSLGYVWLHDFADFLQAKVFFRLY